MSGVRNVADQGAPSHEKLLLRKIRRCLRRSDGIIVDLSSFLMVSTAGNHMASKAQRVSFVICNFTQLPKDQCAHCSGIASRISPHYHLRTSWFEGSRIVEILKNGGPVHPYDEHFRFGSQKARLLLGALEVIKEFASNTDDEGNTTVTSQIVRNESGVLLQIWVEMHENSFVLRVRQYRGRGYRSTDCRRVLE